METNVRNVEKWKKIIIFALVSNTKIFEKWCEALSAVGPKGKNMTSQMAGENFDLNHWCLIPFHLWINLKF